MAKKRRKPNLKNPNSMTWRKKADKRWSEQIRRVGRCEVCNGTNSLNAHHIINRGRLLFRHDLSNGICLCSSCHIWDGDISPHVDSNSGEKFLAWLEKNRPGQFAWYQENKDNKRQPEKTYQECYGELK